MQPLIFLSLEVCLFWTRHINRILQYVLRASLVPAHLSPRPGLAPLLASMLHAPCSTFAPPWSVYCHLAARGVICLCSTFSIPCLPDGTTAHACCRNLKSSTNSPCLSQSACNNVTKFYFCFLNGSGTAPFHCIHYHCPGSLHPHWFFEQIQITCFSSHLLLFRFPHCCQLSWQSPYLITSILCLNKHLVSPSAPKSAI